MEKSKEKSNVVVKFAQTLAKSKKFRHDQPLTDELRVLMIEQVFIDIAEYVIEHHYEDSLDIFQEFIDDHYLPNEKQLGLSENLFWWQMLYHVHQDPEVNFIEDYIADNITYLHHKPLIVSWLREWKKAVPKFYYVGYKYNDRVLVVVDMMTKETLDVIVYDPQAIPPKQGEVMMGTLIPIGDALYFPIVDFYHFDVELRESIAPLIHHHYQTYQNNTTTLEAFIHILSSVLQFEKWKEADD